MHLDLNPIEKLEDLTFAIGKCVVKAPFRAFYEANKKVTASFEEAREDYLKEVNGLYKDLLNEAEVVEGEKPEEGLELNDLQSETIWSFVVSKVEEVFKKKLNPEST